MINSIPARVSTAKVRLSASCLVETGDDVEIGEGGALRMSSSGIVTVELSAGSTGASSMATRGSCSAEKRMVVSPSVILSPTLSSSGFTTGLPLSEVPLRLPTSVTKNLPFWRVSSA